MITSNDRRRGMRPAFLPGPALLLTAILFSAFLPAESAPVEIRFTSVAPDGTPWSEHFGDMKTRMEKESGGRLAFKVYMGGQLGGEVETLRSLQRGRIQAWGGSVGALATLVPELNLTELPYLFHSLEEADFVFDEVLFKPFSDLLAKKGLVLQSWNENGWRHIGSKSKPILTPADAKGLKIRSQPSAQHLRMWKALGANPVAISAPEALTSLQTGVVDAFDNSPVIAVSASWHTAVKHFTLTQHIYQAGAIIFNKAWFDKQPEELRRILLGDARSEARTARAGVRAMVPEVLKLMEKEGVQVHPLDESHLQAFAKSLAPLHAEFAKSGGADLLARTQAALTEYRARKNATTGSPRSGGPGPVTAFFRKLDDALAKAEESFIAAALGVMILVVFADFVLRETLNLGLVWAKEVAVYLFIWVGFLGASLAVHKRIHLVIQAGEKLFPPSVRKWTSLSACLITSLLCLLLAWLGARFVIETRNIQEVSLGMGLPLWIVQVVIPVAFLLIGLRFLGLCAVIWRTGPISLGGDDMPVPGSAGKA